MNGWYFLATEVDDICFDYAKKNVEQNNMSDLIKGERCHLILILYKKFVYFVVYFVCLLLNCVLFFSLF